MTPDGGEGDGWGQEPADSGFDVRTILDFLKRRKFVILIVSLPLLIPATVYPLQMNEFYEAAATLVIRTPPEVMEFGSDFMPGAAGDGRMPGRFGGALSENSLITLAKSDAVLGRVVDLMPDEQAQTRRSVLEAARDAFGQGSASQRTPEQDRARRIELLRNLVTVTSTGGGNYLELVTVAGTAGSATFLANSLADAFVKYQEDQREEASRRAVAWLNQQLYELRDQTARKEQVLGEIVSTNNLSLAMLQEGGRETHSSAIEQVEADLQAARINYLAAQERLATLSPRAARPSGNAGADRVTAGLREQFAGATAELEIARLRLTPTHPEVRRLEGVVRSLSERLGTQADSRPVLSATEETEYQGLLVEESQGRARVKVLEKTRDDLMVATGSKAEAVSRYRRLANELEIDKQILQVLMTRRNETLLAAATKEVGAEVLDYAVAPLEPAGPNKRKYLLAGYGLALALGFGLAVALEMIDRRLRDPSAIAALLGTASLGLIPRVGGRKAAPEWQAVEAPGSVAGESYRNVRTSLLFAMRAAKVHCLLVTSAVAGEGKTTTSVNLAGAFGRIGRRVVLVDADMRRPRVHRIFRLSASPGLSEILQGTARLEEAVIRPERADFDLVRAGAIPDNPSELLGSAAFVALMEELRNEYDLVVLDSPVLLSVSDALLLAADADGTLLVHKPGTVDRQGLKRMRDDLRRAGARVLGVVFNHIDPNNGLSYSSYMLSPYAKDVGEEDHGRAPGA